LRDTPYGAPSSDFTVFELKTGARIGAFRLPSQDTPWINRREFMHRRSDGRLERIDPRTGAPLWTSALTVPDGWLDPPVEDGAHVALTVVPLREDRVHCEGVVAVLDLRTGSVVWERRRSTSHGEPLLFKAALSPSVACVREGATTTAYEVASGRVLWSMPSSVWPMAVGSDFVVLEGDAGHGLQVQQLSDGAVLWTSVPAGRESFCALRGRLVIFEGKDTQWNVSARDARTGVVVWQSPYRTTTPVAVGRDAIYVCTINDHLVALDPDTGREQWSWAIDCSGESLDVAMGAEDDVVVSGAGAVFVRGPVATPVADTVVEGRVTVNDTHTRRAHLRPQAPAAFVEVSGVKAPVSPSGDYLVHVHDRGFLVVQLHGYEGDSIRYGEAGILPRIMLASAPRHRVDIQVYVSP
jgi:outer membrane protein assembly factor BamB